MIKYIKRADLDFAKYNACLDNSPNSRIYAYSWYLDIVATNWDALILDDYKAVMPLPWRQKYFIKYIYKPCWTQQLGVFSVNEIDEDLVRKFIKAIPRKFKKITLQLNSDNPISGRGVSKKVNYILPLDKEYGELFSKFKRSRRRRVRQSNNEGLYIKDISFLAFYEIVDRYYKFIKSSKDDYSRLKKLVDFLLKKSMCTLIGVFDSKGNIVGATIQLLDKNRITYLYGISTPKGKKIQAITFVINNSIKNNSNSKLIFDFEGSMLIGVAKFFKSFGSLDEGYYTYQKNIF